MFLQRRICLEPRRVAAALVQAFLKSSREPAGGGRGVGEGGVRGGRHEFGPVAPFGPISGVARAAELAARPGGLAPMQYTYH